jgi:ATP-binding cassette subfamily F protein 3
MRAKDVLLESLETFNGTVVFVSHDRYFIDKLATRIFEIGGGQVHVFPGNYEDYVWRKQNPQGAPSVSLPDLGRKGSDSRGAGDSPAQSANGDDADRNGKSAAKEKKKINPYKLREMEQKRGRLEAEIARAEAEIADAEQRLLVFQSAEETIRLTQLLDDRRQQLTTIMAEWEQVSQELETVQ